MEGLHQSIETLDLPISDPRGRGAGLTEGSLVVDGTKEGHTTAAGLSAVQVEKSGLEERVPIEGTLLLEDEGLSLKLDKAKDDLTRGSAEADISTLQADTVRDSA